jgi:predicted membrane protein
MVRNFEFKQLLFVGLIIFFLNILLFFFDLEVIAYSYFAFFLLIFFYIFKEIYRSFERNVLKDVKKIYFEKIDILKKSIKDDKSFKKDFFKSVKKEKTDEK